MCVWKGGGVRACAGMGVGVRVLAVDFERKIVERFELFWEKKNKT